jgi:hypothetical protein
MQERDRLVQRIGPGNVLARKLVGFDGVFFGFVLA